MSRNRIYVFLIGILLVSNLALVAFFVLNKPEKKEIRRDKPGGYMKDALKSEVGFNDQQMAEYEKQVEAHRQSMRPMFEDITKTKEDFYRLLMQPGTADSVLNNAATQIGEKQKLIDMKIFMHFQNIRLLCTPSQQPSFDTLIQHVVHRMVFPGRRPDSKADSADIKK